MQAPSHSEPGILVLPDDAEMRESRGLLTQILHGENVPTMGKAHAEKYRAYNTLAGVPARGS